MRDGVSKRVLNYHLKKAEAKAEVYQLRYGKRCIARVIRASNGEAAIVYDIFTGRHKTTILSTETLK